MTSKITLILLIFSITFISFSDADSSRILQSQISGDTSLPIDMFTIENLFEVHYEFLPPGSITFAIKFNAPNQFFALGLGTQMAGADIWAFQVQDGQVTASDRRGIGHVEPLPDTQSGGTENLQVLGYEVNPAYSLIKFTRLLDTGDSNDNIIQPGLTNFIYATAVGSPTITYHGPTKGSLVVDLINNDSTVGGGEETLTPEVIVEEEGSLEEWNSEFENVNENFLLLRLLKETMNDL